MCNPTSPPEWHPSSFYSSLAIFSLCLLSILLSCSLSFSPCLSCLHRSSILFSFLSLLTSFPFLPPVPAPCKKPQWLWVAEAVSFLLQWGLRQDDHQHHRRGLCLPEWILGLHRKARHYTVDWQVEPWRHTPICSHGHNDDNLLLAVLTWEYCQLKNTCFDTFLTFWKDFNRPEHCQTVCIL